MHGPGTTAAAVGTAGFEAEAVPGVAMAGRQPAATTAPPQMGVAPVAAARAGRIFGKGSARSRELPCKSDPDLFFAESPEDVECAKALCGGCPARHACLTGAMDRREPWGVWGGELFLRGEVVPRKRPRGRPRKSVIAA